MATNVSSVTKHFPKPQPGFTTTASGSVSSAASTVGLNSTGDYSNGDVVVLIIDPADSNKKQVFTGTIDIGGSQVTGVVWTDGDNQAHASGATIVDYTTATHVQMLSKGMLVQHKDDGTHADTITTNTIGENSAGNGVTVDGLNLKDGKLNTNDSVVTANITNSAVSADKVATDSQVLAYVETTTGQSFNTTGPTDATSMSVTFTTPASCTKILLRAEATISSDTAAATNTLYITDSSNAVQVKRDKITGQANVGALQSISVSRRITVAASTSYTFKLRVGNSTGTTVLNQGNGATSPTELWVERA